MPIKNVTKLNKNQNILGELSYINWIELTSLRSRRQRKSAWGVAGKGNLYSSKKSSFRSEELLPVSNAGFAPSFSWGYCLKKNNCRAGLLPERTLVRTISMWGCCQEEERLAVARVGLPAKVGVVGVGSVE